MKYIFIILLIIPILVLGQGGEVPIETPPVETPDTGTGSDSSAQATPTVTPVSTLAPTAVPKTTNLQSPQPTPTPRPSVLISETPSPILGPQSPDQSGSNLIFYVLTAVGIGALGILAVIKAKTKKKGEDDEDRCGSIKELLEQKKKELEEYILNLPQEKVGEFIKDKSIEELKKDEDIKKILETIEGAKEKYDKFKEAIELLEKQYNLCMLSLPSSGDNPRLSFLMGTNNIKDKQFKDLGIKIVEGDSEADRRLIIPDKSLDKYLELIKSNLSPGFWNEVVGEKDIIFIFKFKDGSVKEYKLSPENEKEISELCSQFNNDPIENTSNVYKYVSKNSFYHDFILEHHKDLVER